MDGSIGANPLEDICWNPAQLLSLNNSIAVQDLNQLLCNAEVVGIESLISMAIDVIQKAAETPPQATPSDIVNAGQQLASAPIRWLNATYGNITVCQQALQQTIDADFGELFNYQFGSDATAERVAWISYWRCSGATFGCSGDTLTGCPAAETCFSRVESAFAPFLYAPGQLTSFGNDVNSNTGRFTPLYSESYIANQLVNDVSTLTSWELTAARFALYSNLIQQIETSAQITIDALNATAQVSAARNAASLSSSYTQGNLYFMQAGYNFNVSVEAAAVVALGPIYYPSGCPQDCVPNGNENCCLSIQQLYDNCQREMRIEAAFKIIGSTVKLAAACIDPFTVESGKGLETIGKAFQAIGEMVTTSEDIEEECQGPAGGICFHSGPGAWDPTTTMPPIPNYGNNATAAYVQSSSSWYLSAEQNLSNALVTLSPAFWDSVYLENSKVVTPILDDPPSCNKWKDAIIQTLTDYLANVKNFTDYGNAMTTAEMALVPALGNIATGLATISATEQASAAFNEDLGLTPNYPTITTAPPETFQNLADNYFNTRFPNDTKALLALSSSLALMSQEYISAQSILSFCSSYSYMNAGLLYDISQTVSCSNFGGLYLPSTETFDATVQTFVGGTYEAPPSVIGNVLNNQEQFANSVKSLSWHQAGEVSSSVPLLTVIINANNSNLVYGNLADGSVRFTLTPGSDLMYPFTVEGVNPRVINVQAFWRGVTSKSPTSYSYLTTEINVAGPYAVYAKGTGLNISYTLPSMSGSSGSFAQSNNVEKNAGQPCLGGTVSSSVTWDDGSRSTFCTESSASFSTSIPGLADQEYVFPSLWGTWNITAEPSLWSSTFLFNKNPADLALAIQFTYLESNTTSSSLLPQEVCYGTCGTNGVFQWPNPLLGEAFCTGKEQCSDCKVADTSNLTTYFCQCNVWNGATSYCGTLHGTSFPVSMVPSSSFVVTTRTGVGRRHHHHRRRLWGQTSNKTCQRMIAAIQHDLSKQCVSDNLTMKIVVCDPTVTGGWTLELVAIGIFHHNHHHHHHAGSFAACVTSVLGSSALLQHVAARTASCAVTSAVVVSSHQTNLTQTVELGRWKKRSNCGTT